MRKKKVIEKAYQRWKSSCVNEGWIDEDGYWWAEYHTSHSWDAKVRKATPEEIEIDEAFIIIRKIWERL